MSRILPGVACGAVVWTVLAGGCLTRPVVATKPAEKTNFTKSLPSAPTGKVDLLFDIDNSASMGDKQQYLAEAIPDLITRLIAPNCVDDAGGIHGRAATDGTCSAPGTAAEFPPVRDMHIGILSSSLGPRLGNGCKDDTVMVGSKAIDRHNDDAAHLLNRSATLADPTETPLGIAQPGDFLSWFPVPSPGTDVASPAAVPITKAADLQTDFEGLVVGVHQYGCGIESQLESWYRFLVQPDPYASLALAPNPKDPRGIAEWVGIDKTILAQRAAFLRPDSLVAVIVLSDENDSEVDVRALGGLAYKFMDSNYQPPRGTSACAQNPADPACTSCAYGKSSGDPECMKDQGKGDYTERTDWGLDINLRHVHEKQKYGVDVQFPIERYVLGLTSKTVPNRDGEYPAGENGNYATASYQGLLDANRTCTNPLFAATLPAPPAGGDPASWSPDPVGDLCHRPLGQRPPSLVYYAHIGGVPHELLQVDPSKKDAASQAQKATLSADDWTLILGNDPQKFDYAGIDPHMIESFASRTRRAVPARGFSVSDTIGADPIAGNEWTTNVTQQIGGTSIDLEYACIFPLKSARDCGMDAVNADPSLKQSCDCTGVAAGTAFPPAQQPSVCDHAMPTQQRFAKAYPTIRELLLAKLLGDVDAKHPGIVSSLCPIHTDDNAMKDDPLYGYRPAVSAIVAGLKSGLGGECLPEKLRVDTTATPPTVPCLVVGTFPGTKRSDDCRRYPGYKTVDPSLLKTIRDDQQGAFMAAGGTGENLSLDLSCELEQLTPNVPCASMTRASGWCYVEGGKNCAQAIQFAPDALKNQVVTTLQCLEASIGER